MRFTRLRVRGYRRLSGVDLDLDHDRILVVGDNEAGKSTLLEALVTGLYGLAPDRRGRGHPVAGVAPWSGGPAGLAVHVRTADDHELEVDWDLTGERTQVIDHTTGVNVSTQFDAGYHGWRDVGAEILGIPASVFREVTVIGEGELARISDPASVRESLLRAAEAGADVVVDMALRRLDEGARQATSPRVNAATRHNQLRQALEAASIRLEAARSARRALDDEVAEGARLELELAAARSEHEGLVREQARRQAVHAAARWHQIQQLADRLAAADSAPPPSPRLWSPGEVQLALDTLAAPVPAAGDTGPSPASLAVVVAGALALLVGIQRGFGVVDLVGLFIVGLGVYLMTRSKPPIDEPLQVGEDVYPDRQALMVAVEAQRVLAAQRGRGTTQDALRGSLELLLEGRSVEEWEAAARAVPSDPGAPVGPASEVDLAGAISRSAARIETLSLNGAGRRGTIAARLQAVPEVAPIEEEVEQLTAALERLQAFGAACALAAETLRAESDRLRKAYAPRLQAVLSRDMGRVTGGRYTEALVADSFEVQLRSPETGSMVDLGLLSRGTQQQVHLSLRLGLLAIMETRGEALPLFLDDALALSDDGRRDAMLRVLEDQPRQVFYFAAGGGTAEAFGPAWRRVPLALT